MKKYIQSPYLLEFIIALLILIITGKGIFLALGIGILLILVKYILNKFNTLPLWVGTSKLKTIGVSLLASTLLTIIKFIF